MTDVIKSTLPPKENHELAEELLARFPGVDRAELLKDVVASCFFEMRHGNKRKERAACDLLNEVQRLAILNWTAKPSKESTAAGEIEAFKTIVEGFTPPGYTVRESPNSSAGKETQ